jgi:hypothetical protein
VVEWKQARLAKHLRVYHDTFWRKYLVFSCSCLILSWPSFVPFRPMMIRIDAIICAVTAGAMDGAYTELCARSLMWSIVSCG